jgi:PAS domain S-box-containing protein
VHWLLSRGRAFFDSDGQLSRVAGIAIDVTARKRIEAELSSSQEVLAMAIEAGQLGIWDWDMVSDKMVWSDQRKAMSGLPRETEMSLAVSWDSIHPEDRARVENAVAAAMATKVDTEIEYRTVWPDGSERWLHSRGRVFEDATGKIIRSAGISLDVTQRKENEAALRRFNTKLECMVDQRTEVIEATLLELRTEITERRRLEEEILSIAERQQAQIGQDLHDDLGQQLVGIAMLSHTLSGHLKAESHPKASDASKLKKYLTDSIATTRNLAKSYFPVELERGGLILALHDLAHRTEALAGIVCQVSENNDFQFEKTAEIHLYRIVQESINNALKHGKARNIKIDFTVQDRISSLHIIDDGSGFDPAKSEKWDGMGLHLFQYRARLIGAVVTVTNRADTGGCQVSCQLSSVPADC